jgi:rubrerythrin
MTHKDVSPLKNVKTVFAALKDEMMQKVEATTDELEAFKIAMKMEREGKAFYEKTLSQVKTEKEKALLERLIREEQQHYEIFSNTYQFLSDTGNWFMWDERGIVEGG